MHQENARWQETPEPHDRSLSRLRRRWQALHVEGAVPLTTSYDPQSVPELLPWTMLIDVENAANPYRHFDLRSRFIGSAVGQYFGVEGQQRLVMSEIGEPFAERWFDVVDRVLETRSGRSFSGAPYRTGFDFLHCELLVLPFSTDGTTIDSLLAAVALSMIKRAD